MHFRTTIRSAPSVRASMYQVHGVQEPVQGCDSRHFDGAVWDADKWCDAFRPKGVPVADRGDSRGRVRKRVSSKSSSFGRCVEVAIARTDGGICGVSYGCDGQGSETQEPNVGIFVEERSEFPSSGGHAEIVMRMCICVVVLAVVATHELARSSADADIELNPGPTHWIDDREGHMKAAVVGRALHHFDVKMMLATLDMPTSQSSDYFTKCMNPVELSTFYNCRANIPLVPAGQSLANVVHCFGACYHGAFRDQYIVWVRDRLFPDVPTIAIPFPRVVTVDQFAEARNIERFYEDSERVIMDACCPWCMKTVVLATHKCDKPELESSDKAHRQATELLNLSVHDFDVKRVMMRAGISISGMRRHIGEYLSVLAKSAFVAVYYGFTPENHTHGAVIFKLNYLQFRDYYVMVVAIELRKRFPVSEIMGDYEDALHTAAMALKFG